VTKNNGYNQKSVGHAKCHLGGAFFRVDDGTLVREAKSYIQQMLLSYEVRLGGKPKEYSSPMTYQDHPHLQISEELDLDGIKKYQ
jgi:hypothetical protein